MLTLVVVGVVAGVVTSLSPCVLPVLPVILASGTSGPAARNSTTARSWRPYGVVAGLVISFSIATLLGSVLLSALGLPQDLLRNAGIVVLAVIGLSLVVPQLGELLERPFTKLGRGRAVNPDSNGIVLGLGLGLLFVPCAGPVLATIAVVGATHHISAGAVVLTAAFGVGVGIPLLVLALAGDQLGRRVKALRERAKGLRIGSGVIMLLLAGAIAFNLTDGLQRQVPGYASGLFGSNAQLRDLTAHHGGRGPGTKIDDPQAPDTHGGAQEDRCSEGAPNLVRCGKAPDFTGIDGWLNTPGDRPLTLHALRGKVVLVDFWTYSCINCQRTLPYLERWYRAYHGDGLEIVGVHTPEFAFEHVTSNIREQAAALGVKYPIAIDNDYGTWNAYGNQYWPAEYLIDAHGNVRHVTFGEGGYEDTENLIRQLLSAAHPATKLGGKTDVATPGSPTGQTPETYLGAGYPQRTSGTRPTKDRTATFTLPKDVQSDTFALGGEWHDGKESLTAGKDAVLALSYRANKVYLVLSGTGTVGISIDGEARRTVHVGGVPRLYTLVDSPTSRRALLTLDVSTGVEAYDFTFG